MSLTTTASPYPRDTLRALEASVERLTGRSVDALRSGTITDIRRDTEKACGRSLRFVSRFPFIGRGNVLRDRVVTHEMVERQLDEALG